MSSLIIHKKHGINARSTTVLCPICLKRKPDNNLLLLGHQNSLLKCTECGRKVIGTKRKRNCPSCKAKSSLKYERELHDYESIDNPGLKICSDCINELQKKQIKIDDNIVFCVEGKKARDNIALTGAFFVLNKKSKWFEEELSKYVTGNIVIIDTATFRKVLSDYGK